MEEKYTKIGILSFWWSNDNYGQLLQLFGLYRYVSNQGNGYLPEIICYRPGPQEERKTNYLKHLYKIFNPKKVYKFIKRQILRERLPAQNNSPIREFNDFRENHLKFSKDSFRSFEELAIVEHDYDFIIVGSDQVWNYFPSGKNGFSRIDAYTLHFPFLGENRLSYAASMGFGGLEDIHLSRIVENLNAFKGVSVREESAKTILESQGIKDVEWVPDPSMLLTSDHYLRLVIDDDKYQTDLFVYYVNNSSVLSDQDVSLMLDETDGSYVFVGANNLYNKKLNAYPTVEEWLSYIYHDLLINCSNVSALKVTQLFTSIESARKWDEKTKEENSKSKIDKRTKKHILKEMRTVIENERYASILSEDEKTSILQRLPEIFRIPNSRELENIFINNGIALKGYEKRIISSRNIFLHGEVKFQEIC